MPTVAMTGGTAAPGGRAGGGGGRGVGAARRQAAARAVKAPRAQIPRVTAQRPQHGTASPPARMPRIFGHAPRGNGGEHATAKAPGQAPKGPTAFNPIQGFMNSQQLGKLAGQITRQNMESELSPLRQQAQEIGGTQATVAGRYSGYSNATNSLLAGIGQQAEAGAKTFENQAADAALKAGQGINQTGQAAASQDGGYLDPQVQAELNAQGKLAAGAGAAQNSLASTVGEGETGFMSNLRAAAAQRALEGQKSISNLYGQQLNRNQAEQDKLIAKQPGDAKSLAAELGQKQFTDYATMKGLGIKQATINLDGQKVKLTAKQNHEKDRLTERGQNITATKNAATTRIDERKIAETERHNRADEENGKVKAEADLLKANAGASKVQREATGQIGTAWSVIQKLRSGPSKSRMSDSEIREVLTRGSSVERLKEQTTSGKSYSKSYVAKYPQVKDQALITAAMELWNWHQIKPATVKELERTGITVPPNWTNGTFQGF